MGDIYLCTAIYVPSKEERRRRVVCVFLRLGDLFTLAGNINNNQVSRELELELGLRFASQRKSTVMMQASRPDTEIKSKFCLRLR